MAENADLINKFTREVSRLGTKVFLAKTPADAVDYIVNLVKDKGIKTAVKANSEIAVKLELNDKLAGCGIRVTETSIVQWTLQLLKGKDVPVDEVAALISSATGQNVGTESSELLKAARKALKEAYANADLGITEADVAIAETGSLITLENESNARLARSFHQSQRGARAIVRRKPEEVVVGLDVGHVRQSLQHTDPAWRHV